MVFNQFQEPLEVWRLVTPTSGYADPTWTYMTTISGRIESISPSEVVLHNQAFDNIMETLLTPVENLPFILSGDGIIDGAGIERKVVGQPEIWKWLIPHLAIRLERSQWSVTS